MMWRSKLYRYALMILADPAAAADAVHDVFIAVLRLDVALTDEGHYLRRAVRNECYTLLRRRRRWHTEPLLEPAGETADPDPALRLAVEQALRQLPPEQREVIHLKVYEGLTFQEIATLIDESINTVASRYRYAVEKMRDRLGARR